MDTYFESHVHNYSPGWANGLAPHIKRLLPDAASLLDIGCGTGNAMQAMAGALGVAAPVGVESSQNLVRIATEQTGCRIINASVLDDGFPAAIGERFDIVMLASVLHHLVGRTRRRSFRMVEMALQNARKVVAPGGLLVVYEPVFKPFLSLSALFYVKLLLGGISRRRIGVGSYWANIGAPLVSYLTPGQITELIGPHEYSGLTRTGLPGVARLAGMSRYNATFIARVGREANGRTELKATEGTPERPATRAV